MIAASTTATFNEVGHHPCQSTSAIHGLTFTTAASNASHLYAGVPLIALVFPVAAVAVADVLERRDQVDAAQVLRHLVAELARNAQAQRRAVRNRQCLAVELPRQQRLRMVRIVEA